MIEGYTTVKDIANKWEITVRIVQIMCAEGKNGRNYKVW